MKLRLCSLALLLSLVTVPALAHGNKVHVRGTIEKISSESVLVKTPDGKSVEVKLVASTVYVSHTASRAAQATDLNVDKPAKLTDLAVGNMVVIHATAKENGLEADEIKFSAPTSARPATAAPAKPRA